MMTNLTVALALAVGMTAAIADVPTSPTCCIKRAYCCRIERPCCRAGQSQAEATAPSLADAEHTKPTCCVKRAHCCSNQRSCCGRAA